MKILENVQFLCLAIVAVLAMENHPNPDFRVVRSAHFRQVKISLTSEIVHVNSTVEIKG